VTKRLKIASWNINSVRARTGLVERLIAEQQPDILCLQETKAVDAVFPAEMFRRLGYKHQQLNGQRMHHGVAILSRLPLKDPGKHDWQDNGEARHVGARLECDVWSHKALLTVVSHTPIEVETLGRLQQAHGWIDVGRKFVPVPERCFTWWSYRSPDWTKNDRGRRLDHMWVSPELGGHVESHRVLESCRSWERPSDHVPLICELSI
jgi:exodeoxyribonuclease-3